MFSLQVLKASSTTKDGIPEVWNEVEEFFKIMTKSGELKIRREKQHALWMWNYIKYEILELFKKHPAVMERISFYEEQVAKGNITSGVAADELLNLFIKSVNH